jgi:hypothetical protein
MSKTFALSDPHGDIDRLKRILRHKEIIDLESNWIAKDATLVCAGDLTDRGPRGIEVIELMMKLETQSESVGGQVVSLMGNHDALILAHAYEQKGGYANLHCQDMFTYNGGLLSESLRLSQDEEMFEWMKNRPLMFIKDRVLFQHADTCYYYLHMGNTISEINENGIKQAQSGPGAWSIFYEMCDCRYFDQASFSNEEKHAEHINAYMKHFDVDLICHGHTRHTLNHELIYFNSQIINLDGSMSIGYRSDIDRGFVLEL